MTKPRSSRDRLFDKMDKAAEHLADQIVKSGPGEDAMPLDDAADAFKALVQYATLKYKYKEDDPDGGGGFNFANFGRASRESEEIVDAADQPRMGSDRRRPS